MADLVKFTTVDGRRVAYAEHGDGGGMPLLVLHGFTGHRDDFEGCWDAIGRGRRVFVPDLPGHGDTARAADEAGYTFAAAIEMLLGFLDTLDLARVHVLGHSMGGMIALRLALDHAERVASLLLMSTSPDCPIGLQNEGFGRAIEFAREHDMAELQRRVEEGGRRKPDPVIARWSERYWTHHARRYLAMDPLAYAGFGGAMREQVPVTERLAELAMPVGVIVGGHDADFLPGADAFEAGIPGVRRWTLADAGHHPHVETGPAWEAAVMDWLAADGA